MRERPYRISCIIKVLANQKNAFAKSSLKFTQVSIVTASGKVSGEMSSCIELDRYSIIMVINSLL